MSVDVQMQIGESLADFEKRVHTAQAAEAAGATPQEANKAGAYVEPSLEEQRRLIRDETIPEPVRRYWRERLYGKGGGGRKEIQQERIKKTLDALNANFQDRTLTKLVEVSGNAKEESVLKRLPGKQRKRARRLLRQMAKVVKSAAQG